MPCQRRFVVCLDGTWNDGINTDLPATNVARIARSIKREADGIQQIVYYRSGVGTGTSTRANTKDAAFGTGIDFTIREAYFSIAQNYAEHDEIVLIGFSRGAFAVRVLAHFIQDFGIMKNVSLTGVFARFKLWKDQQPDEQSRNAWANLDHEWGHLSDAQVVRGVKIAACAVWDIVAALQGDEFIPGNVKLAIQALALNEERSKYSPLLWKKSEEAQILEQCWFLGTHGDVGGAEKDLSLANITFAWMIEQLSNAVGFDIPAASYMGSAPFNDNDELTGRRTYSYFQDTYFANPRTKIAMSMEIPLRDFQDRTDIHVGALALFLRTLGRQSRRPFSGGTAANEKVHWSVKIMREKKLVKSCPSLDGLDVGDSETRKDHLAVESMLLESWLFADFERIVWKGLQLQGQGEAIPSNDILPTHAVLTSPTSWEVDESGDAKNTHVMIKVNGTLKLTHERLAGVVEDQENHALNPTSHFGNRAHDWEKDLSGKTLRLPVDTSHNWHWSGVIQQAFAHAMSPSSTWHRARHWYGSTTPMLKGTVDLPLMQKDSKVMQNQHGGFSRAHKRAYLRSRPC